MSQGTEKTDSPQTADTPFIPASKRLPELTIKALVLGIFLSILLSAANAYLGLLAGMTVSASIPAAVISLAVLRFFRRRNILENNMVQTCASAGESLAAGVIFTFPALILMGAWTSFDWVQTTIIAGVGGILGVLFTIPLRRALVVDSELKFPEGVATAELLKAGEKGVKGAISAIVFGGVLGAIFKIGDTGLKIWTGVIEGARRAGDSIVYFGSNLSPALLGVGYIVGLNIAILVFIGGGLNWYVAIPIISDMKGWPVYEHIEGAAAWNQFVVPADSPDIGKPVAAEAWAYTIWSKQTRYLGVGAMVVGGIWALVRLFPSLVRGIAAGFVAYRKRRSGEGDIPRTEIDIPMQWVGTALMISVVPLFVIFGMVTSLWWIAAFMAVIMLIAGFLFSAVAAYMAGLVGSSNNPISGVTIATLLASSFLLLAVGMVAPGGPVAAILIGAVVCCAAAIGGDNLQDLKAGHILGSSPWKMQIMQVVGVVAAALVIAPVLTLLLKAYGIGSVGGTEGQTSLEAPQASLMASVAEGVFGKGLPWGIVFIGMALAGLVIILDLVLEAFKSNFRTPVLAVAVGIYLPLELSVPILLGGVIHWVIHGRHKNREQLEEEYTADMRDLRLGSERNGLLMAAGLITGEAILGILLAIPLVFSQGANPMAIGGEGSVLPVSWGGAVLFVFVCLALAWKAMPRKTLNSAG
ncbi:MAG: oligopeptide transporter, OPT family [Planctomycetota bacterium]|nr:oligopeptide transporter, OPT family [Planctomycetota bacterium]